MDTNQIYTVRRTRDEEKVVHKIMEGNIKYCLEIVMKAQSRKKKNTAVIHVDCANSD